MRSVSTRTAKDASTRLLTVLFLVFATGASAAAPQAPATTASPEQPAMTAAGANFTLFDLQNPVSIHGTVRAFSLSKAYSRLWLDVTDSAGDSSVWDFQAASSLELRGLDPWSDHSLNPGDQVTVEYFPFRNIRRPGGILISVTTADGRTLSGGTPADFAGMNAVEYSTAAPINLQASFDAKAAWQAVVIGQTAPPLWQDIDGPPSQSKICFVSEAKGANDCAYFRDLFKSPLGSQAITDLSVVSLSSISPNTEGLVLKATGFYTSGEVHETAIWVYDQADNNFSLVSALTSDEERIVTQGPLDGFLITVNWNWEKGEARWDDHRRKITVYRFAANEGAGAYREVLEYTTAKKYDAEDTHTIDSEMNVILTRLGLSNDSRE
jgi:hypothetical protein